MLRYPLTHPEIIGALAAAGHGSTVLLADANYPHATAIGPNARLVLLNLRPGQVPVDDVLATVLNAIPVEAAHIMQPDSGPEPPVFSRFRELLGHIEPQPLGRHEFYAAVGQPSLALAVATGDQRLYANIMLTIGVVAPS
jgi:L-fucose mutarotase